MSSDRKKEKRKARAKAKKIGKRKQSFIPPGFTEVMRMSVLPNSWTIFPSRKVMPMLRRKWSSSKRSDISRELRASDEW